MISREYIRRLINDGNQDDAIRLLAGAVNDVVLIANGLVEQLAATTRRVDMLDSMVDRLQHGADDE